MNEVDQERSLRDFSAKNPTLAEILEQLLHADDQTDSFLASPMASLESKFGDSDTSDETELFGSVEKPNEAIPSHIGEYRVLQRIGEGGHGEVFMAEQRKPIRRKVAVKLIKRGMESKDILARFEAERQALAMMQHPSIANVMDAGTTDENRPFFVMELVHGAPIDEFCLENRLSLRERLELFCQVCSAVHHAHRKGIIHRDLKPANVMVTTDSGKPLAKVIDFGIAKAVNVVLTEKTMFTQYGQIVGTLEYMSPEQATMSQNSSDVRSDVYSLGVILYVLLTGQTPISKNDLLRNGVLGLRDSLDQIAPPTPSLRLTGERQAKRWVDQMDDVDDWRRSIQGDLDWITMKSLAKRADERYDSASELEDDVRRFLEDETVLARPPSMIYRTRKFMQRHRTFAIVSLVSFAAILVSIFAIVAGYIKAKKGLDDAQVARTELANANGELTKALVTAESEKDRADRTTKELATILQREMLESAWEMALDGEGQKARNQLKSIANRQDSASWQLAMAASQQLQNPALRPETAGAIRALKVDHDLGLIGLVTNNSSLEVWDIWNRTQVVSHALASDLYAAIAFSGSRKYALVAGSGCVNLIELKTGDIKASLRQQLGGTRDIAFDSESRTWLLTTGANYLLCIDEGCTEILNQVRLPDRVSEIWIDQHPTNQIACLIAALNGDCYYVPNLYDETAGSESESEPRVTKIARFRRMLGDASFAEDLISMVSLSGERVQLGREQLNVLIDEARRGNTDHGGADNPPTVKIDSADGLMSDLADVELAGDIIFAGNRRGELVTLESSKLDPTIVDQFLPAIESLTYVENRSDVGLPEVIVVVHFNGRIKLLPVTEYRTQLRLRDQLRNATDGQLIGDSTQAVTAHADGSIKVWNTTDGASIARFDAHTGEAFCVSVDHSQTQVASFGSDWKLSVFDLRTHSQTFAVTGGLGVRPVVFSHSGKLIAGMPNSQNSDNLIEGTFDIWDLETESVRTRLVGHSNWIGQMQFSSCKKPDLI